MGLFDEPCAKGRANEGICMAAGTEGGGDTKAHDDPDREPKAAAQRILFAAGARAQYLLEVVSLMTESIMRGAIYLFVRR
mmetsp:Transcript_25439/g.45958  ORF Transcript_25439/g.45958 Transcript_25439/m.45958 type:complete len:80 (+) Transcript_25439:711-950(+)